MNYMGIIFLLFSLTAFGQFEWQAVDNEHCKFYQDELTALYNHCENGKNQLIKLNTEYEDCLKKMNKKKGRKNLSACESIGDKILKVVGQRKSRG